MIIGNVSLLLPSLVSVLAKLTRLFFLRSPSTEPPPDPLSSEELLLSGSPSETLEPSPSARESETTDANT